jgi:hypothetical protein
MQNTRSLSSSADVQFPLINSVTFDPTVLGRIIVKAELSIDEFSAFVWFVPRKSTE